MSQAEHDDLYPEHAKLRRKAAERDTAQEFYDFLHEQGLTLARYHEHSDGCYNGEGDDDDHENPLCGFNENLLYGANDRPADLIGKFLSIDPKKLEREKRAMLDSIRKENG